MTEAWVLSLVLVKYLIFLVLPICILWLNLLLFETYLEELDDRPPLSFPTMTRLRRVFRSL